MNSGSLREPCNSFQSNKADMYMALESDESLLLVAEERQSAGVSWGAAVVWVELRMGLECCLPEDLSTPPPQAASSESEASLLSARN